MTLLDYRYRCPATGCPCAAAVVGEAWDQWMRHGRALAPPQRRYTLRCTAGHVVVADKLREVA